MLGPVGWMCFIAVGGLLIGIVVLEQAALLGIIAAHQQQRTTTVLEALRFSGNSARPVLLVTARMVAMTLLAAAPFLAVAGLVYVTLLTKYDINYYLTQKPASFWIAIASGAVLSAGACMALFLRLVTGWFFALQIILFEGRRCSRRSEGQSESGQRVSAGPCCSGSSDGLWRQRSFPPWWP